MLIGSEALWDWSFVVITGLSVVLSIVLFVTSQLFITRQTGTPVTIEATWVSSVRGRCSTSQPSGAYVLRAKWGSWHAGLLFNIIVGHTAKEGEGGLDFERGLGHIFRGSWLLRFFEECLQWM